MLSSQPFVFCLTVTVHLKRVAHVSSIGYVPGQIHIGNLVTLSQFCLVLLNDVDFQIISSVIITGNRRPFSEPGCSFWSIFHQPICKRSHCFLEFHNSNLYCLYHFPIHVVDGTHFSFADYKSVLLVVSRVKAFIKYHKHILILYFTRCPRFNKSQKRQHYNN